MPNNNVELITSDHLFTTVDHHFKVFAGPGAGKTYWLINNVKRIVETSTKLNSASKIACITYTNVAVEEIKARLNMTGDRVEVSTIHSFLYKCLVKPYAYLITHDDGRCKINIMKLDGHDDHIPSTGRVMGNPQMSPTVKRNGIDNKQLNNLLASLEWHLAGDELILQPRNDWQKKLYKRLISTGFFNLYKQMFWDDGILHHEDVLYFSYEILKRYPLLRSFIAEKYPYVLVDEFQDTHPVQTQILKWIAEAGAVIGVIGDPAQSIYQFQGASRVDFIDFMLPGQKTYAMKQNRRSTRNIVNILNHMRGTDEVIQECYRDIDGNEVCVIVDKSIDAIMGKFKDERTRLGMIGDDCIVSRKNDSIIKLKSCAGTCNVTIWNDFLDVDPKRQRFMEIILSAQEYANRSMYETAVNSVIKVFKTDKSGSVREPFTGCTSSLDDLMKRSMAVSLLEYLLENRDSYLGISILDFYNNLIIFFSGMGFALKKVSAGGFKRFAESMTVKELVHGIKLGEEKNSNIRTIHKSKGAEFQSVLVYFEDSADINHILNPDLKSAEDDCRLLYVALSRAEDFLCIATHELSQEIIDSLGRLNVKLVM